MVSAPMEVRYHTPEEEIALGPACWLWDYLVRSGGGGFFLPLSGGADSASTASIVGSMCQLVLAEIRCGNSKVFHSQFVLTSRSSTQCPLDLTWKLPSQILEDLRRVVREPDFVPVTHQEIANRILHTTYMGTRNRFAPVMYRVVGRPFFCLKMLSGRRENEMRPSLLERSPIYVGD